MIGLIVLVLAAGAQNQDQSLREAARLDTEQRCEEAERLYQTALARQPRTIALLNNLGNHYLICGDRAKARLWFERLVQANPAHLNANLQLARIETGDRQGAKALQYLSRVKETGPAVDLLRAEASYYAGKSEAAASLFTDIERKAGGDPRVLFPLGVACARAGLYDRAERAFQAVLEKYPGEFDVLFNLGRAAARAGHYDRARSVLEAALKIRPGDAGALLELGLLHAARQDYPRSVFLLAQAGERLPKRADIQLALARSAEGAGYYGDAVLAYDRYLELRPEDDGPRRDRALVLGLTGTRLPEALRELSLYMARHPRDPVAPYDLARLTWRDHPAEAMTHLNAAIRSKPDFAPALLGRAWLLYRMGRIAESLPDLLAANKAVPGTGRVLEQLGLVYLSLDRPAEAEKVLRQALASSPEGSQALLHLGRTLMALGREEEGEAVLSKFQKTRGSSARGPLREAGMIELASLPAAERTRREIERLRNDVGAHPGDSDLQFHFAALLLMDGKTAEATLQFRELLSKAEDAKLWHKAGAMLLAYHQYQLAAEFLSRAAGEFPRSRLDLAIALFHAAGTEAAVKVLDGIAEEERDGDYLLLKAQLLDSAGKGTEALRVLRQGLGAAPSRPEVAEQTAILLVRLGQGKDALEFLERALAVHSSDPELLLIQAAALYSSGRMAEAEKKIREIETRWPEWDRGYLAHGLLLEQSGRRAEARRRLQTAAALGATGLSVECAIFRVSGAAAPKTACGCAGGLWASLFGNC
ncbi:MAG: tetratricopeptide repeat protein [Bryobacterales bacterium]|nr:tetratricopeptide repeat protein [Bryobacterales bacterium]